MDLLIPDLNGILKGKRVRRGDFDKCCKGGFVFCAGSTLLTTLGEVVSGVPYGADDGDPDLPATLIPAEMSSTASVPENQSIKARSCSLAWRFSRK